MQSGEYDEMAQGSFKQNPKHDCLPARVYHYHNSQCIVLETNCVCSILSHNLLAPKTVHLVIYEIRQIHEKN